MKKIFVGIISVCLVVVIGVGVFSVCTKNNNEEKTTIAQSTQTSQTADKNQENVQVVNPFTYYNSIDEAKKAVGVTMNISDNINGYDQSEISTLDSILQIIYTKGNNEVTVRISNGTEDNSGFNTDKVSSKKIGNVNVKCLSVENSNCYTWTINNNTFSVSGELSETEINNISATIIDLNK